MFEGFKKKFIKVNKGKIFCRIKGNGPPLLLLHGYPQTHAMWNKTAPELSKNFTVVVADLRGYGNSLVLPGGKNHINYSKREIAKDMIQFAIACGAYVCQGEGAIDSQPYLNDVESLLSESTGGMS